MSKIKVRNTQMKVLTLLTILFSLLSCIVSVASEIPTSLLNSSVEELKSDTRFIVKPGDFEDEDTTDVHTEEFILSYDNGDSVSLFADNGIINKIRVTSPELSTKKGIKVGDTLAEVKSKYPDSVFAGGSKEILQKESLFLYTLDNKITFVFYDKTVSDEILSGKEFKVTDPRVQSLKLWGMYLR